MFVKDFKADIDDYAARVMRDARLWKAASRGAVKPDVVASYLYNLFLLVTYTEPYLALARVRANELGLPEMSRFFQEKLLEESGHEAWAEADLASLRRAFGAEYRLEPKPAMQRLLRTINAALLDNPASYVGYATFVEYFTVIAGPPWIQLLSDRCGIPAEMLTIVGNHVELDVEHAARGFDEMARLIRADDESAVMSLLREVMSCLDDFYDELADDALGNDSAGEMTHAA